MMEQSKRSMELQLSQKSLYCAMLDKEREEQKTLSLLERKKKQRLKEKIKQLKVSGQEDNHHSVLEVVLLSLSFKIISVLFFKWEKVKRACRYYIQ